MKPSVVAAVGLRIIATWLLLQALFGSVTLVLVHHAVLRGYPELHSRWSTAGADMPVPADLRDSIYLQSWFSSTAAGVVGRFFVGLGLFLGARPLGRIVTRKLDAP